MAFPPTILLVDDDADGRFFAERSLQTVFPGCSVVVCSSATAALQRLADCRPDAIVTDHQLGRQSGCEFIAEVRRQGITCPVVMVTCSDDPDVAQNAMRCGATKVFRADGDQFADFLKTQIKS